MMELEKFISAELLGGLNAVIRTDEGEKEISPVCENGSYVYAADGTKLVIKADETDDNVVYSLDAVTEAKFTANPVSFKLSIDAFDGAEVSSHDCPWWMIGSFPKNASEIPEKAQCFMLRKGDIHYSVVMLVGDCFRCEANGEGLQIRTGFEGLKELHGPFLTINAGKEPIANVSANYANAKAKGAIKVPLIGERKYPDFFEYFGWCSWNAFYQQVTEEKLCTKLDEFREKKIPIKWIIIDDGWSLTEDGKLKGFDADPVKFPNGLAAAIKRIKTEYGIEKVGVWHAFNGYWSGVLPGSDLAKEYADCLMTTVQGGLVPSDDPEKAFIFWDAWHSHLAECGVDFLKVDNQSSSYNYLDGTVPTTSGARHAHEAIERSIIKNFGGNVIDCMGMDMENYLQRPYSAISRNSDDFFPDRENGFAKHIRQNVYSAIWHSCVHYCDFDMWWSGKSAPVQSGVLRAISGGPVYVSDAVGDSDLSNILPVCGEDGDLCRLDRAAMPTEDCLYIDCEKDNKLLKIFSTYGDAYAVAAFNISRTDCEDIVDFSAVPGLNGDYIAYEYFTKTYTRVNKDTKLTLKTGKDDVSVWSLYPVRKDEKGEYIEEGESCRYVGIASRVKVRKDL